MGEETVNKTTHLEPDRGGSGKSLHLGTVNIFKFECTAATNNHNKTSHQGRHERETGQYRRGCFILQAIRAIDPSICRSKHSVSWVSV